MRALPAGVSGVNKNIVVPNLLTRLKLTARSARTPAERPALTHARCRWLALQTLSPPGAS